MAPTRNLRSKSKPELKQTTLSQTSFKRSAARSSANVAANLTTERGAKVNKTSKSPVTSKLSSAATERVQTDVLLSIYPVHLADIVAQRKNYEYRNYRLRDGVERLWLYETGGSQKTKGCAAITHIATIPSNIRRTPGTVPDEPVGIGNADFNAGLMSCKFGYEIIELYELVQPITLDEMKTKWGMGGAPMGRSYVKQDMWQDRWGEDEESRQVKVRRVF
ncbi:hypothetical protein BKA56DRAFT_562368 [Ilyonectria sp. MPI-CAGE-AT-0026]|nr:hypothetical protein BKA56DRAFT_562368 [Ilyonectria sp. MPI-CAGE-AT-0026]